MKRKIVKLDKGIRKKYPQIYKKMANRAVYLLRKSNYRLYNIASAILRKTSGI